MRLETVNPSVKVITGLVSVIMLSFTYFVTLNVCVFLISMLLLTLCTRAGVGQACKFLLPAAVAALCLFVTGFACNSGTDAAQMKQIAAMPYAVRSAMSTDLYSALQLSTRLLAYAGLGILFTLSTDGEELIFSLIHQCHMSVKFAYGILAAVHLLPTMVREYRAVRLTFLARGMRTSWFSMRPVFTMLVNAIRWSGAVAMAMESKGFCPDMPRTYAYIPKVRWYDYLYALCWGGGILAGMLFCTY